MSATLRDELAEAIARGQVVIVAGAGMSIAATVGEPVAGWGGLLEDGVDRGVELGLSAGEAEIYRSMIRSQKVDLMVSGAELVTRALGGSESGEYKTWLRGTVGSLTCRNRELIEALADLGALIATTNYDGLLEEVTRLPPVTWRNPGTVQRVLQDDEQRIIHLHGHWEEPESVVLGISSYGQVMQAGAPQEIQQALTVFKKLVFVGCGEGLTDPNFAALRSFLRMFQESESRHYRLCTESEAEALRHEHEGEPIRVLPYGEGHGDLLPFLRGLRPPGSAAEGQTAAPAASTAEPKPMGTAFDVPPLQPDYIDRPEDLDRIRELLGKNGIVAITGRPGAVSPTCRWSSRRRWRRMLSYVASCTSACLKMYSSSGTRRRSRMSSIRSSSSSSASSSMSAAAIASSTRRRKLRPTTDATLSTSLTSSSSRSIRARITPSTVSGTATASAPCPHASGRSPRGRTGSPRRARAGARTRRPSPSRGPRRAFSISPLCSREREARAISVSASGSSAPRRSGADARADPRRRGG